MLARMTMSDITIISSMSVNPPSLARLAATLRRGRGSLPVTVLRPVPRGAAALRIHVEHVLAAPTRRIRFVLIGPQPPLGIVGNRIDRNAAEEFELAARRVVGDGHSVHQLVEIRRVSLVIGAQFGRRDEPRVHRVLELIDGCPDLPQVPPQLCFALTLSGDLRWRA